MCNVRCPCFSIGSLSGLITLYTGASALWLEIFGSNCPRTTLHQVRDRVREELRTKTRRLGLFGRRDGPTWKPYLSKQLRWRMVLDYEAASYSKIQASILTELTILQSNNRPAYPSDLSDLPDCLGSPPVSTSRLTRFRMSRRISSWIM